MRKRRLFGSFALALPVWLCLAAAAPPPALAQPAGAEDDVTRLAREQFLDGIKAYDAGQFDKARLHFLQAYALKRHPAVLLNLGQSELKTGEIEAAGNHLQQFLREHKDATEAQRTAAREGIEEAQRRTGFVVMVVDVDGAVLSIDGQAIGTSPLLAPYFVKPGQHEAAASKDGRVARGGFVAERGKPASVMLTLSTGAAGPLPAPTPSPDPAPNAMPAPGMPGPYPQPGLMPFPHPSYDPGPEQTSKDPISWFKDRPGAWVGVGFVGVGIVGMIVSGAIAGDASSAADSVQDQIIREAEARNLSGAPCGPEDSTGSDDAPGFANACNQLRDNLDTRDDSLIALGVFGAITGAALIGTIIYYFVDTSGSGSSALVVSPMLGADTQGLSLFGTF